MDQEQQQTSRENMEKYLSQLSNKERRAYQIASSHLQTSFDLEKSIGYKKFLQNQEKKS